MPNFTFMKTSLPAIFVNKNKDLFSTYFLSGFFLLSCLFISFNAAANYRSEALDIFTDIDSKGINEMPGAPFQHYSSRRDATMGISISAAPDFITAPGQEITFSLQVENTGDLDITNIVIADTLTGFVSSIDSLNQGTFENITFNYLSTQGDIDIGGVSNFITILGSDPDGLPVGGEAAVVVVAEQSPVISVSNSPSSVDYNAPGQEITFTIEVGNTGNVTLNNITIADDLTGFNETIEIMAPGGSDVFTTVYTVEQSDIEIGSISNTVTVSGFDPGGVEVGEQSEAIITASQNAALSIHVNPSVSSFNAVGQQIFYELIV